MELGQTDRQGDRQGARRAALPRTAASDLLAESAVLCFVCVHCWLSECARRTSWPGVVSCCPCRAADPGPSEGFSKTTPGEDNKCQSIGSRLHRWLPYQGSGTRRWGTWATQEVSRRYVAILVPLCCRRPGCPLSLPLGTNQDMSQGVPPPSRLRQGYSRRGTAPDTCVESPCPSTKCLSMCVLLHTL